MATLEVYLSERLVCLLDVLKALAHDLVSDTLEVGGSWSSKVLHVVQHLFGDLLELLQLGCHLVQLFFLVVLQVILLEQLFNLFFELIDELVVNFHCVFSVLRSPIFGFALVLSSGIFRFLTLDNQPLVVIGPTGCLGRLGLGSRRLVFLGLFVFIFVFAHF